MQQLRIGGVPEHFNYPWHQCVDNQSFVENGLDVQWKDFPGGTGEMSDALAHQEIDLAIMLTEGCIKQIGDGEPLRIVQKFVETPLLWGIYVAQHAPYFQLSDLKNKKAAISREGSGSHLMAYVNAKQNHWDLQQLSFETAYHLQGAVEALQEGKADYFMWEHFTTKPLVDQGVFRHIEDCPTPWPCFVIVGNESFLTANAKVVQDALNVVNKQTQYNQNYPFLVEEIATAYHLQKQDVDTWLKKTRWSQKQISNQEIDTTVKELQSLGLVPSNAKEMIYTFNPK